MKLPLTPAQEATLAKLVAQGWPRAAAEFMVVESEVDVIEETGPSPAAANPKQED